MDSKACTMCKNEKQINIFHKKKSERKDCYRTRGLKHYFDNKDKVPNKQKIYWEKIAKR